MKLLAWTKEYRILLHETVFDWADRTVEFEFCVMNLSELIGVLHPNPLSDILNHVNTKGTIYAEHILKIVRESTPQCAPR